MAKQINDIVKKVLTREGYEGSANDMIYRNLGDLGHTGSINDRLFKFGGWKSYSEGLVGGADKRFAPNFNGVSQYGDLPKINLANGDVVVIRFIASLTPPSTTKIMTDSDLDTENRLVFFHTSANLCQTINCNAVLDGSPVINNSTPFPYDGVEHEVVLNVTSDCVLGTLCARSSTMTSKLQITPLSLIINDGAIYNFPIDDGWANNPIMRNTGSGANGTFVNMTEASWVEIDA